MNRACPTCQSAVAGSDIACPFCGVKVARSLLSLAVEHAAVTTGDVLARLDFTQDPLPGKSTRISPFDETLPTTEVAGGLSVSLAQPRHHACIVPYAGARDLGMSLRATAIDEGLYLGVFARRVTVGDASVQLLFSVQAHKTRFELAHIASTPSVSGNTVLAEGVRTDCIAPLGQPNTIDLRVCGGSLIGSVNGKNVCAIHDPSLGSGAFGVWLERTTHDGPPRQAIVSSFEARRIPR